MHRSRTRPVRVVRSLTTALTLAASVGIATPVQADVCSSGAHTLSTFGDRVYPEMGNGGYRSVHTDIHIVYDTATNLFLPGNHVELTDQATQCLSDFSLDFERSSANLSAGPNMTVDSITVNGDPATFTFVQPTYPGDPNGQDDPDPAAHAVSNVNPVSASNPNPPACSPQVGNNSQNGQQCPANKLVITPSAPIPDGSMFTISIAYTGRPGVYNDGDGTTEGWFRSNTAAAPNDGAFVTTEPVGSMAWMPLNNHPSAKPTYDIYDTVNAGKTAISAGELVSVQDNPPDANFPGGSVTWHWHSPEPIASYLLTNSIGSFDLTHQIIDGIDYFQAQASSLSANAKAANKAIMDQQPDITRFESQFNGPFPFTANGVQIGLITAGFEEEMQTKIAFQRGTISLGTFNHENMHQWFGDNVSEAAFNLTFWKEGWATVGQYLQSARTVQTNAGGPGTPAGDAAFDTSLINRFNTNYGNGGSFWTGAPSKPTVGTLFTTSFTYTRPGTAYLALRQILDASASRPASDRWIGAMKQIQSDFGGGTITEAQLEDVFHQWLPNQSTGCHARLDDFFMQWFDTAYPGGGGLNRPQITGPGLAGPGFYDDNGPCTRADQTITFDPLPDRSFGDPDFNVTASSDSGLPVSFAAGGPCSVSGNTVHITGLGSCTITASQAGDGVFKPAMRVSQTFLIRPTLTALSDAHVWVGLKNSDDQGTRFDLQVELLKNSTPVASGLLRCVTGVTRNSSLAKEVIVPWDPFSAVTLGPGDVLALRVSTRIGTNANNTKCAGHNNAVGLRLYYDALDRASSVGATLSPDPSISLYLHSDGSVCPANGESAGVTTRSLDPSAPTATSAKCKDSSSINFNGGNPWAVIGVWSRPPQA